MKLYVTYGSPYARLARMVVVEKGLEGRVEILEAKTRTAGSPYYQINPSGRVPYLVDDAGIGMEDSQLICAYLDSLDGKPRFHRPLRESDWAYRRLEANARSMCEGICVWVCRKPRREAAAGFFHARARDACPQAAPFVDRNERATSHAVPAGAKRQSGRPRGSRNASPSCCFLLSMRPVFSPCCLQENRASFRGAGFASMPLAPARLHHQAWKWCVGPWPEPILIRFAAASASVT